MNNQIPTFPQFTTKLTLLKEDNEIQIHTTFQTNLRILHNGIYYLTPCTEHYLTTNTNVSTEYAIIQTTQRFIKTAYMYSLHLIVDTKQKDSFNNLRFTPDPDQRTEPERTIPFF